jgi:hypothetical protein
MRTNIGLEPSRQLSGAIVSPRRAAQADRSPGIDLEGRCRHITWRK